MNYNMINKYIILLNAPSFAIVLHFCTLFTCFHKLKFHIYHNTYVTQVFLFRFFVFWDTTATVCYKTIWPDAVNILHGLYQWVLYMYNHLNIIVIPCILAAHVLLNHSYIPRNNIGLSIYLSFYWNKAIMNLYTHLKYR